MNVISTSQGTFATYRSRYCQFLVDWPHAFHDKKYAVSMIIGAGEVFDAFSGNRWTVHCVMDDYGNLVKVN